jgi:hypothetical protein
MVKGGVTPEDSRMIQAPAERRRADGAPGVSAAAGERCGGGGRGDPAAAIAGGREGRKLSSSRRLGSARIWRVCLDTPADVELVKRKVKLLSVMAGNFVQPKAEFNVQKDTASARRLFDQWPGEIVVSGFEIGEAMKFPAARIEKDFAWAADHPVVDAYRAYMKMPYDRQTWDLTRCSTGCVRRRVL